MKCHKCGELGHFENECPKNTGKKGGTNLLIQGDFSASSFIFCQVGEPMDELAQNNASYVDSDDIQESNGIVLAQPETNGHSILSNWIILDNGSTVDVFSNGNLLQDVEESRTNMRIHCNAGTSSTNLQGDLRGYGKVWYSPQGIANILSLHNLTKKFRVTFNSANEDGFVVHKPNGEKAMFRTE